ncbi:MAG TPA: acyl-CoA dehydrogenase [Usitatibacter sp.]|nr:acyl-CoA dehydrogenase [Usitatibacter sp.]
MRFHRAQAGDPREPHGRARVRREGRRDRLPRRRGPSRPRVHVHHDERRAPFGGARGRRDRGACIPARARLVAREDAGQARRRAGREDRAHRPASRREAHVAHHEIHPEAMRALAYWTSAMLDRARMHPDDAERRRAQALVDLLIPVVKGWSTEMGIEVASLGIQVHGGMGFIEETGAAQHLRDARITTIYEGTTGIQANDLVGRKMGREEGRTALALIAEMEKTVPQLAASSEAPLRAIGESLRVALDCLRTTVAWVSKTFASQPAAVAAASVYVLKLMGITLGGWMLARSAQIASEQLAEGEGDAAFLKGKILTARFFAEHVMAQATSLSAAATRGAESVLAMEEALL